MAKQAPTLQELMLDSKYQEKQAQFAHAQRAVLEAYRISGDIAARTNAAQGVSTENLVMYARMLIPEIRKDLDSTLKVLDDKTESAPIPKAS